MNKVLIVITALMLAGCVHTAGAAREKYIAETKPDPVIAEAIRNRKIRVGMSQADVTAAWGPHCGWCRGTRQSTWGEVWEYNMFGSGRYGAGSGTYVFFDNKGRVRSISR